MTRTIRDGGVVEEEMLTLAPAERADVLIDLSEFPPDAQVDLVDVPLFGDPLPVLRFIIGAAPPVPSAALPAVPFPRSARLATAAMPFAPAPRRRRPIGLLPRVIVDGQPPMLTINDRLFHDMVEETVELEAIEEWEFLNVTGEDHPLHLHLVNFEVLNRRGIVVDPTYAKSWVRLVGGGADHASPFDSSHDDGLPAGNSGWSRCSTDA